MLDQAFTQGNPALLVQNITIETMQGTSIVALTAFDAYQHKRMTIVSFFAVRASCSALVSIVLFLLTTRRRTPVFFFNQTSLILMFIQSTLFLVSCFSPFSTISTVFTNSYADVTQMNINISIASSVFQLLFLISIECSLVFQARTVFPKNTRAQLLVTVALGAFALATVAIYTLYITSTCWSARNPTAPRLFSGSFQRHLPSVAQLMFALSVTLCTLIFVGKLLVAIRTRRVLGMKQFGPLQIVCVMGAQSMILPAILTLLSFQMPGAVHISSLAPFLVVISLPLSALWASAANTNVPNTTLNSNPVRSRRAKGHKDGSDMNHRRSWSFMRHDSQKGLRDIEFESDSVSSKKGWSKFTTRFSSFWMRRTTIPGSLPFTSQRRQPPPPPIELDLSPAERSQSYLDSAYTPGTAREYMSRHSFEERGNYRSKYQMSTRVSIRNIDGTPLAGVLPREDTTQSTEFTNATDSRNRERLS